MGSEGEPSTDPDEVANADVQDGWPVYNSRKQKKSLGVMRSPDYPFNFVSHRRIRGRAPGQVVEALAVIPLRLWLRLAFEVRDRR